MNLLSLRSDFTTTVLIFGANGSSGCSPEYNGNSVSVHSQTDFWTRHRMSNQSFQVFEKEKDIRFHSILIFLELVLYRRADLNIIRNYPHSLNWLAPFEFAVHEKSPIAAGSFTNIQSCDFFKSE